MSEYLGTLSDVFQGSTGLIFETGLGRRAEPGCLGQSIGPGPGGFSPDLCFAALEILL
jgi:hypothetical protein